MIIFIHKQPGESSIVIHKDLRDHQYNYTKLFKDTLPPLHLVIHVAGKPNLNEGLIEGTFCLFETEDELTYQIYVTDQKIKYHFDKALLTEIINFFVE